MFINYSTPYVLKMYILMNLFFVLLLVSNDLTLYLLILESFTLYFGLGTIYCMLEGNCNYKVFWIFIIYILGHVASFFFIRGYFPKTMSKFKIVENHFKDVIKYYINNKFLRF